MNRSIVKTVTGTRQTDGAGVRLVRVLDKKTVEDFDPFLMLDAFDSTDPADYVKGFPWHPHRGIETVTFLIRGDIEHGDSLGNAGAINDGCCQWMTAGSGIIHQEMPKPSERMLGVQLWLNLPASQKMTQPKYRDLRAEMIPTVSEDGCDVRIISGTYRGVKGATQGDYVATTFLDANMKPQARWSVEVDPQDTVFLYIVEGAGRFDDTPQGYQSARHALLFGPGESVCVQAGEQGARFFVFCAKALREPVAWGGPIVMNTREELREAFAELDAGTFIKKSRAVEP